MALEFSAHQKNLREKWFGLVETPDDWNELGPVGEGESQSIRVQNKTDGMRGIAKPGLGRAGDEAHCRAAHEKLAFDLACVVDLPVSAVVLWNEKSADVYKRGRAISSWAFPQNMKWSEAEARNHLTDEHRKNAAPVIAMMRAFHTWICDTDRKGDHIMVDIDSPPDDIRLAFIDHGHSLSHTWHADVVPGGICPHYLAVPEVPEAIAEAADAIAHISDEEVQRIVNRIPLTYLPALQRGHIISNLLSRKGNLRAILGV